MKKLKVLAIILVSIVLIALSGGLFVNFALPNVGTAPTVKVDITPERVLRGKYLANHVAACMDCHSSRNWEQYAGPMVDGTLGGGGEKFEENMGFPGKIYSSNITPHTLSSWTDGEILKAITTGESKDGRALFPVMAYPRFGKMDQEDIYSIIAYIRLLKPISKNIPQTALNFPVNLINKTLPTKANFQKIPSEADTVKYGGYLVNAAGCIDCHSKTDKGKIIEGTEFGGGMEFKFPTGTLTAPNITMHKTNGLGNWTKDAFIARFKFYVDSNYKAESVGTTVLNTTMPWTMYAGMKETDLAAIYGYLKSLKPSPNKVTVRTFNK
ncbi:c-type cytochrome [Pedobacter frigoris]|uniref:Cytochrome C n=1 Tax=Pedobacter frigoris TaxID=2571272 RepID=A0A4U1CPR5_9SPHI|nr:cytochrome C [Pedobacter frigoris]TKC07475.1 cytochrome C [Pedobacter frigoris]